MEFENKVNIVLNYISFVSHQAIRKTFDFIKNPFIRSNLEIEGIMKFDT